MAVYLGEPGGNYLTELEMGNGVDCTETIKCTEETAKAAKESFDKIFPLFSKRRFVATVLVPRAALISGGALFSNFVGHQMLQHGYPIWHCAAHTIGCLFEETLLGAFITGATAGLTICVIKTAPGFLAMIDECYENWKREQIEEMFSNNRTVNQSPIPIQQT